MKSKDPVNHHYVPKVYLKQFAQEDNCLFQLCKQYRGISKKHISQVCYEKDYFKFQREESKLIKGIKDDYYVEKRAFTVQENSFSDLANSLCQYQEQSFDMRRQDIKSILTTLVTIKRRNPSFRELLTGSIKQEAAIPGLLEKYFAPYLELARTIDKDDPLIYLEKERNELINESSKADDIYVSSFIDKRSTIVQRIVDTFLLSAVQVYHAPFGYEFLTSDNPGFVIYDGNVTNLEGLGGPYLFAFPLTPTACLVIDSDEQAQKNNESVSILPQECMESTVDFINSATARIANKKIFSRDKERLEYFRKRYMNY